MNVIGAADIAPHAERLTGCVDVAAADGRITKKGAAAVFGKDVPGLKAATLIGAISEAATGLVGGIV
jgi:hypothetical protein